jgi:hypothetical protein
MIEPIWETINNYVLPSLLLLLVGRDSCIAEAATSLRS